MREKMNPAETLRNESPPDKSDNSICTQLFRYLLYSEPDESEKRRILERVLRGGGMSHLNTL